MAKKDDKNEPLTKGEFESFVEGFKGALKDAGFFKSPSEKDDESEEETDEKEDKYGSSWWFG